MSESDNTREADTAESSGNEIFPKNQNDTSNQLEEKLRGVPGALEYLSKLEKQIRKQKRKIKKLKTRIKHKPHTADASIQTDPVLFTSCPPSTEPKSITEEIKEAAELATQNTGFVYDESSGLYYDSNTGYYYNAEYGLYYDAATGTYMSYRQDTNTYEFHSRVHLPQKGNHTNKEVGKRKKKNKDESKAAKLQRLGTDSSQSAETEEGECSESSGSESSDQTNSDASDISKQWPPCMRIIVEQSQLPKIKIGSLHILTFEGGTLGREGNHAIILPDINISKCHLKFTFDKEKNHYFVKDLGSRNGTILNGKRMSNSKNESDDLEVAHGSRIQIGSVVLLCHIHEGYKTCGHCEPGLVQVVEEKKIEPISKATKSERHKSELKKLRKKFGVNPYEEGSVKLGSGYTDRAQKRRDTVGSQNAHEKTEVASLNNSISSQNKGFKMLSKMGWKEGQSLGKDNQGILEPIPLVSNPGTSGVGNNESVAIDNEQQVDKNKQMIWKKTQERFKTLLTSNVFDESD